MFARSKVHRMNICDVSWFDKFKKMAESKKAEKPGGRYCIAGAPNKESCKNTGYTPGISMHTFPTEPKVRANGSNSCKNTASISASRPAGTLCYVLPISRNTASKITLLGQWNLRSEEI